MGFFSYRIYGIYQWTCLKYHAGTATKRWFVDRAPFVWGKVAKLYQIDFHLSRFDRASDNAHAKRAVEHLRKQRNYRNFHLIAINLGDFIPDA
jgi:ribosomal protein S2